MHRKRADKVTAKAQCRRSLDGDMDAVSVYVREVRRRRRLTAVEETSVVEQMVVCREKIADLLRAVLLKACDTLELDAGGPCSPDEAAATCSLRPIETYLAELPALRDANAGKTLRTTIAQLADKARLAGLEDKIMSLAALTSGDVPANEPRRPGKLAEADVGACYGLSMQEIRRVAAVITESRRSILQAKELLVEGNLRLVVHFARQLKWRGAELADLVQEGNLALMRAVDSYDPGRGLTFGTFAGIAIRHAIQRLGATASRLVRVPEEVRLRRRRVQKAAEHLSEKQGGTASLDAVAQYMEVSNVDVMDALEGNGETCSLDAFVDGTAPSLETLPYARAVDVVDAIAASHGQRLARDRIRTLDDRKRRLIEARYTVPKPATLADIGREFGITRERARQIEERALRELRTRESGPARQAHARTSGRARCALHRARDAD